MKTLNEARNWIFYYKTTDGKKFIFGEGKFKNPNKTNLHYKLNKLFTNKNIISIGFTSDTDRTMYQIN